MPAIVKQFHLSENDVKFVAIAIGLIGYIVGSNLVGALAHRRGRRLAFLSRCSSPAWDPSAPRLRPGSSRCRSGVS
jgi:MFS family permease